MKLSFITRFENGKPTYFLDKIHECETCKIGMVSAIMSLNRLYKMVGKEEGSILTNKEKKYFPKIHTLRKDKGNYWKKGNRITFCVFKDTQKETDFGKSKCTGTQRVVIVPEAKEITLIDPSEKFGMRQIEDVKQFAKNDGFDTVEEFWQYFDKPEAYKIIHWTNFKY